MHHHHNPTLSIFAGAIFGISTFFTEHGWVIDNILELFKVISFGLIGGACGYIGKIIATKIHTFLKNQSKKHC